MKKKLTVIHGDKGGIGKTTFAFLHADFLLYHHGQIVIVKGDKKISDVADRLSWDNFGTTRSKKCALVCIAPRDILLIYCDFRCMRMNANTVFSDYESGGREFESLRARYLSIT